ncbi:MAG: BamA/TamA family outer membrane protein [Bdellovibrionales bacterium]|nr:BamA/TamA family outer membrane protein [Bdellovibrionales bacterium]
MFSLFVPSIIVLCFTLAFPAFAQTLKIHGAQPEIIEFLRKKSPELFDNSSSLSEIDYLVRLLMEHGSFERVSAYRGPDGNISIEAQAIKLLSGIKVTGNRIASTAALLEIIELKEGDKFDKRKITESGERLKAFYSEQGYFNAIVEIRFANASDGRLESSFVIDEKSPCKVSAVEFTTLNPYLQQKLQYRSHKYLHQALTAVVLQNIKLTSEEFLKNERFLSAAIGEPEITYDADRTSASLTYSIQDPYKYDRQVIGYKQLSIFDISRELNPPDAAPSGGDPISEAAERIRKKYLASGFAHAQVSTEINEDSKQFLRKARILIYEGPRVRIAQLDVSGRISRNPQYYAALIRNNSSELIKSGYFSRIDIELGHKNLINELRNQGFLKARIQSLRTEFTNKKSEAKIKIVMDEGPLTQVKKVDFLGIKAFNEAELNEVVTVHSNTPLRLSTIEESINRLKSFYLSRGFLEMKIENINNQLVEYNEKGTQAIVRFEILEGPKIIVSAINLEGNKFTKDYVILREIEFSIGETLTPEKIEESQMRLNRLGIFSQVRIRTLEEGTSISQRTVLISLRERDPGLFKIGVGADSERDLTLRQFTSVSFNNIEGTARTIAARLELGYNPDQVKYLTHRATIGYLEPFLFSTRTRGRINFTRQQQISNFNDVTLLTEISDSSRVDFLLERDLARNFKLTWTLWSLDSVKTFERYGNCLDGQPGKCPDQLDRIALLGPTLDYDLRDNPFVPTRGSHVRWNLSYSDPAFGSSSDVNFVKSEISYTYLWNLGSPSLVWANQLRHGNVSNLSTLPGSKVPGSQIFYLGGTSSIRGFGGSSSNERIPQGVEFPNEEVIVERESEYSLIKSEFRFPVYNSLGGVVFYDGGAVQVSGHHFERPYRHAAGFGVRFNTPVGPVSLDIGFKLDRIKERNEDPWRLHFFIGSF